MDQELQVKVTKMLELYTLLSKKYRWSAHDISLRFVTFLYTLHNKEFVLDDYDNMLKHIKNSTKILSNYRGSLRFTIAALLDIRYDDPQNAFLNLLSYEEEMKQHGFKSSPYLGIAAYALLLTCDEDEAKNHITKAMDIYKRIKANHRWLTSSDDYPVAILLAEKDTDIDSVIAEMEACYQQLNHYGFSKGNGLQFLSHMLTFSPEPIENKAKRCKDIFDYLKREKLKISSPYYGTIGSIALLGNSSKKALEEIVELSTYLKKQKQFKWVAKDMNILITSALITDKHLNETTNKDLLEAGMNISLQAMIAAQTAALVAASSAAVAASTAATT